MLSKEFHGVKISGIACAVPYNKVNTDDYLEHFGETTIRKFKKLGNSRY